MGDRLPVRLGLLRNTVTKHAKELSEGMSLTKSKTKHKIAQDISRQTSTSDCYITD